MKMDGRLGCNPLQGQLGDAIRALICGAGAAYGERFIRAANAG